MSRLVSRAEGWEKVYTAFANINFAAFDYNTVKQSILDYIKLYFPETFNDFIESSELIAIIESFAYIAELLAYRIDVTAHENFISTAQRRDSVLKLAKLISYKASRPLPARGLVKITSVTTTETLIDSNGTNLSGRTVRWNDTTNPSWKDQFVLILNRALDQDFGSVVASDRFQIQDVLFEIYPTVTTQGVMPYSANVYGQSINMELVPVAKASGNVFSGMVSGIEERRPQRNAQFTLLYGSDGLGDGSETTGFFCFTKQGTLQRYSAKFDGITPNQIYDVPVSNVNDTDVWVNNIDAATGDVIVRVSNLPYRRETVEGKYGEWVEVDIAHAQNVIFNTNPKRNKYEIETVGENKVRILFGDGEFADVPSGDFDIWARTSLNDDVVVPQATVVDVPVSFSYVDSYNQTQTFSFTVTLINSLTNASAAESTEHVRQTAPSAYYTQDRMVNGEDYNVYMRQNPTILKLRATNRTFAGDSKYITWHDSSNTYENVKMFGDDGILYLQDTTTTAPTPSVGDNVLISTYIEPLLTSTDVLMQLTTAGVPHTKIRRVFNSAEKNRITQALTYPPAKRSVDIYYNTFDNQWYAVKTSNNATTELNFGGYQIIDLNGFASSLDKPLSYPLGSANPHTATIVLPTGTPVQISLAWTNTSTFGDLLNAINSDATVIAEGIVASLYEGNIKLQAPTNAIPAASHVHVLGTHPNDIGNDTGLFTDIVISTTSTAQIEPLVTGYAYPTNFIVEPLITVRQITEQDTRYDVSRYARRIVLESRTTQFWNTNTADLVMDYDTLYSSSDTINILQANTNCNRTNVLQRNWNYNILGQELVESGPDTGMADIHRVSIMATDENADRVPDYLNVEDSVTYMGIADIIVPKLHKTLRTSDVSTHVVELPVKYVAGMGDITCQTSDGMLLPPTFAVSNGTAYSGFGMQYYAGLVWQPSVKQVVVELPPLGSVVGTIIVDVLPVSSSGLTAGARYLMRDIGKVYTLTSLIDNHWVEVVVEQSEIDHDVATLPPVGTAGLIVGDVYKQSSDNKTYVYTSTTWIPAETLTPATTLPGRVGDRYLVSRGTGDIPSLPADIKIYTVTATVPYVTDPQTIDPTTGQPYATSLVTAFDGGVTPQSEWALLDIDIRTHIEDPITHIMYPQALEFYGTAWAGVIQPTSGLAWEEVYFDTAYNQYLPAHYGQIATAVRFNNVLHDTDVTITANEYVYFQRISASDEWLPIESTDENILNYVDDYLAYNYKAPTDTTAGIVETSTQQSTFGQQYKRHIGRSKLNFAWFHFSPRYQLVDPSPTNIIDIFVITRGYFISFKRWLEDPLALPPTAVTPLSLRNDYNKLLDNKMASDTVVLHPGTIKLMFGDKAAPALQARMKVIRSVNSTLTDNQIKNQIVATTRNFFDIAAFEFGETFYFTELAAAIHMDLSTEISSVVLVPTIANSQFGDLLQVFAREDEILYPDIGVEDIDIVTGFTATNLRING